MEYDNRDRLQSLLQYGSRLVGILVFVCLLSGFPLDVMAHDITDITEGLLSENDVKQAKAAMLAVEETKPKTLRKAITKIKDPLMVKTMRWFMYTEVPNGSSFEEISRFVRANPEWPRMAKMIRNAEEAMKPSLPSADVLAWFGKRDPHSTQGWVRFAAALLAEGHKDDAITIFRQTWIGGKFTKAQENKFYRLYRKYLSVEDHEARLDRLLWEGKYWPARRMFWKVNEKLRLLSEARFLLRHMRGNVDTAIAAVPNELKNHPGLVYERLRWRRRKGKDTAARELLAGLDGPVPYPELWFKERSKLARRALNKGLISESFDIISNHGLPKTSVAAYADAEWMAGWIALQFLEEPNWGYRHFVNMAENVRYPISLARGGYWAGRAASALGQSELADKWYKKASIHTTTYYGQLASLKIKDDNALLLPLSYPVENPQTSKRFEDHELVHVARLLKEIDAQDWLRSIIVQLQSLEETVLWKTLSAELANKLGRPDLAISVAKYSVQGFLGLLPAGYPSLDLPPVPKKANGMKLERALVLALIRQESAFYVKARSRAGAQGLMQLMPSTAKRISKRIGMKYTRSKLGTDGQYNMKIGQSYLSQMLKGFDGSYILALAAYNAGPGRSRRWVKQNGHPKDTDVDAIDWVELIPFDETRNYVQRILEGVQVYRALLTDTEIALRLDDDLVR